MCVGVKVRVCVWCPCEGKGVFCRCEGKGVCVGVKVRVCVGVKVRMCVCNGEIEIG